MGTLLLAPVLLLAVTGGIMTDWAQVRESIGNTVCYPSRDGGELPVPAFGYRAECGSSGPIGPLDAAVDKAFEESSMDLFVGIQGYEMAWLKSLDSLPATADPAVRNANARSAILDDRIFMSRLSRRLYPLLAERSVVCTDCPALEPVPARSLPWKSVLPYVLAFVRVDPIKTPEGGGDANAIPRLSVHYCTGLNTVGELPHDEALARVGFAVARGREIKPIVSDALLQSIVEPGYKAQKTDDERTGYVRRRVHERLTDDPQLRPLICTTSKRLAPDLGVAATGCD